MMLLLLVQVVRDDRCITSQRSWHESSYFRKMPVAGGNTIKSSSGMNASQTKFQEKEGIKDSNDKFFEETLKGGKGTNDQELLRYFVDHSAEAIDWLDTKGITLSNLTITGGMSENAHTVLLTDQQLGLSS